MKKIREITQQLVYVIIAIFCSVTVCAENNSDVKNGIEKDAMHCQGILDLSRGLDTSPLAACDNDQIAELINQLIMQFQQCCNMTEIDFNGTFTFLATLIKDFSGTFTSLVDVQGTLTTDFNGTFTALAECCNQIFIDFNGVFTTLKDIENTLTIDFNGTFTEFASIINNFEATFTALSNLEATILNNFNGTFTALDSCCNQAFVDFGAVFTVLNDIIKTVTFDSNGTLTVINSCCNAILIDFNSVFTVLTDINSTITIDFSGTFTALAALQSLCNITSTIPEPTAEIIIVISNPGYYCLTEDFPFAFFITTSNVTLDLNDHTLSGFLGVSIGNVDNVKVMNGTINNILEGVAVSASSNVILSNLFIANTTVGIEVTDSISTLIQDVTITGTVNQLGVFLFEVDDVQCKRVNLINFGGMVGIGTIDIPAPGFGVSNSLFEDCQILNSNSVMEIFNGFVIIEGDNNRFIRCSVKNTVINFNESEPINKCFGFLLDSNNSFLDGCVVDTMLSGPVVPAFGFAIGGNNAILKNCVVNNFQSQLSTGFIISGPNSLLINCLAQDLAEPALGFLIQADNVILLDCKAQFVFGEGFSMLQTQTSVVFLNCIAQSPGLIGFGITPGTVLGNCVAINSTINGFAGSAPPIAAYDCFSYFSLLGDYTNIPNVQPASQNSGVFARGNNFIL